MGAEGEDETKKVIAVSRRNVLRKRKESPSPPKKRQKKADSVHEPSPIPKNNVESSPVAPKTPSGSASHQKKGSKEVEGGRGTKRKKFDEDESEKQLTVTEHLKQLSEIIDTVEGSYPDYLTGTVNLRDLLSPPSGSKSKDGRKRACTGVMLLKEGLSILTEAEHLPTVGDDSKAEE